MWRKRRNNDTSISSVYNSFVFAMIYFFLLHFSHMCRIIILLLMFMRNSHPKWETQVI